MVSSVMATGFFLILLSILMLTFFAGKEHIYVILFIHARVCRNGDTQKHGCTHKSTYGCVYMYMHMAWGTCLCLHKLRLNSKSASINFNFQC